MICFKRGLIIILMNTARSHFIDMLLWRERHYLDSNYIKFNW